MMSDKIAQLVDTLLRRTQAGDVKWQVLSQGDSFVWSGSNASVMLYSRDDDGHPPYDLDVMDAAGNVIETVGQGEIHMIMDLYQVARRSALNIDKTVSDLLDELGGLDSPF